MRRLVRCVVCVSFHPTREASCRAAAAQRAPPPAIGRALDRQAASSRRADPGAGHTVARELFLQCASAVTTIRAGLRMERALESKPSRKDRVLSTGCDL